jgi:hypothetical protein
MFTDVYQNVGKVANKYVCECCHYSSSKKYNYDKHILTLKHQKVANCLPNVYQKLQNVGKVANMIECECGKEYTCKQSLYVHKKKCFTNNTNNNENSELVKYLMKENSELKNMIVDVCKNTNNNNINGNHNNSHNKTFNLNMFLNEECKDAMNIMDFVDSLKLQLSDLENVGKHGFIEGISNIIVKNLNALEINKRPVHCSDSKREIMYVKDDDKWEKENDDKDKLRKAIKFIAHKNTKLIPEFREKYSDCVYSNSKKSDQYNKLIIEAMGGKGDNDLEKENKIIKNIAKEVIIDKKYSNQK